MNHATAAAAASTATPPPAKIGHLLPDFGGSCAEEGAFGSGRAAAGRGVDTTVASLANSSSSAGARSAWANSAAVS